MDQTTLLPSPADDAAAYEAEVDQYIVQLQRLQQQMQDDRLEIETLQAETRAILADIMHTLRAA